MSKTKIVIFSILWIALWQLAFAIETYSAMPFSVVNPSEHSMGNSLYGYLDLKVHEWIREKDFKNIWVVGDQDRAVGISHYEKRDKMFNWQRPTAEINGEDLYIKCFPGRDYVRHYAALIATYLAIHQREWRHVRYILPDETVCWKALTSSNLMQLPCGEVAILGYGLDVLIDSDKCIWEGEGNFSWIPKDIGNKKVVFIGCRHSYWADVAGRIVTLLANKGFKRIIYVGKLGALQPNLIPNETLATGNSSIVDGEIVHWNNCFDFAKSDPKIAFGEHYSCPSIIFETKEWMAKNRNYAFVDPEIGHMAKAAISESIDFSYLHIISDNLSKRYKEDLSNERAGNIKERRSELLKKVKALIEESLN